MTLYPAARSKMPFGDKRQDCPVARCKGDARLALATPNLNAFSLTLDDGTIIESQ